MKKYEHYKIKKERAMPALYIIYDDVYLTIIFAVL